MTYISLLRDINVAGQKKVLMADLKALYLSLGFENVQTYIQSGNVLFNHDENIELLTKKIEKTIEEKYGFSVPVQMRTVLEFYDIIEDCPFSKLDLVEEGTRVMVTFLDALPKEEDVNVLMSYVKELEELVVVGQEVYLYAPHGYGKTKLNNNFLEKKLKVGATTRNWKSVCKLYELGV